MRSWVVAAACVIGLGCGAKRPAVTPPPDLSGLEQADALVLQGCYDCLLDAHAIYKRISLGAGRPVVLTRLFETSILLSLRHKELAIDPSAFLTEARGLVSEIPPEIEAARYLTLAEAVPADEIGTPHRATATFRGAQAASGLTPKLEGELTWLGTGTLREPFRQYLSLAIDCSYPQRPRPPNSPPRPRGIRQPAADAPPLVAYRAAICDTLNQPVLYRLRADQQRFVEASLFLARFDIAVVDQKGPGLAGPRLEETRARFPTSATANYLSGSFYQAIADCDAALAFYDETIALAPRHESALLGRTMCLSHLKRHDEAIETATRLIAMDADNIADAYYWRAWNHHQRKELDQARADIEVAKRRRLHLMTFTLAGIIEYDQDDLDPSQQDLTAARGMAEGDMNCTAIFYLGLLQTKRKDWPLSAKHFDDATTCYERTAGLIGLDLAAIEARTDLDPTFKARKVETLQASMRDATTQRYASALNGANYYAVSSNIPAAKRLIEVAAADPALAEKVNKLKEWLKDK